MGFADKREWPTKVGTMTAYCLADLFNLSLWRPGGNPNYADVREGIGELISEVLCVVPAARELTIRLYGGWHGGSSQWAYDLRHMVARSLRHFPRRVKHQRLRLQMADHPIWDRSIRLLGSVRDSRVSHVSARIAVPSNCHSADDCTLSALRSWHRGACPEPNCAVELGHILSQTRQKMVDTLLTADALTIASDAIADTVILASDEDDMLPALLALAASGLQLIHLRRRGSRNTPSAGYYDGILKQRGAAILNW